MSSDIASIRRNYSLQTLDEASVDRDAIRQFEKWWQEVIASGIDEPNAMTLATASADGLPAARIVLLKGVSRKGFVFYTNYDSYKGKQLMENPRACLVFFWKELERQVRITGIVEKVSEAESDAYFQSRPVGSRFGAWVSPQSNIIESREWLEKKYEDFSREHATGSINRPDHWGGYLVKPVEIEFWQGRPSRLHDRLEYMLENDGSWSIRRLAP